MTDAKGPTAKHFVASILPQYKGPLITLRLQPSNKKYVIPKTLLCAQSPVFSSMLNGQCVESKQEELILEEDADMVSVTSIEGLCQWLHQHTVRFGIKDPGDHISAIIQLLRLADKYVLSQQWANYPVSRPPQWQRVISELRNFMVPVDERMVDMEDRLVSQDIRALKTGD